jgi:putative ABC transport system permease protein
MVRPMDDLIAESVAQPRLSLVLLGIFAGLAVLLAAVGIYGVMAYSVTQRTHEIGIRIALGAQPGDVLRNIVAHGLSLAAAGIAAGLVFAFILTRLMENMLFGVSAHDPGTFLVVAVLFGVVAGIASWIPARRATRVDPLHALRYE